MEKRTREVVYSEQSLKSLQSIFEYGVETFSLDLASIFIDRLYEATQKLTTDFLIHPECRYLKTKSKMYRMMVYEQYLIIYRIKPLQIEILTIIHGSRSTSNIKKSRSIMVN
jgi:plasmid stabilization system protein ParE